MSLCLANRAPWESVHGPEYFSIFFVLNLQPSFRSHHLVCTVLLLELIHQTVIFLLKQPDFSFISACQNFLLIIFYSVSWHYQKSSMLQVPFLTIWIPYDSFPVRRHLSHTVPLLLTHLKLESVPFEILVLKIFYNANGRMF